MIDAEAKARAIATEAEAGAVEDPVDRVKAAVVGEAEEQAVDAVDRVGDSVLEADPLAAGREV